MLRLAEAEEDVAAKTSSGRERTDRKPRAEIFNDRSLYILSHYRRKTCLIPAMLTRNSNSSITLAKKTAVTPDVMHLWQLRLHGPDP